MKKKTSVVKKARKFAHKIDLDLESEFDGYMKDTENARKLKRIAKEKEKNPIDTAWKHGQCPPQSQYPPQS